MFPSSFGQQQTDDIKEFIAHCKQKSDKTPIHFKYMGLYAVGSRIWMADMLNTKGLDTKTKEILTHMIKDADTDVRLEPLSAAVQDNITALTISNLRNILRGIDDPLIDSHANYEWKSLDVAIINQRAIIVNGQDVRVDLKTGGKYFDTDAHKHAYERLINDRMIENVGLKAYLDKAKEATLNAHYAVISHIERTLRSYIKPLKVAKFSIDTANILNDLLHHPEYANLKKEVTACMVRRFNKKIMPPSLESPEHLFMIMQAGIDQSYAHHALILKKEYETLVAHIEKATAINPPFYEKKYNALMGCLENKSANSKLSMFPTITIPSIKMSQEPPKPYYDELNKVVSDLRAGKIKIEENISQNDEIIKKLQKNVLEEIYAKMEDNSSLQVINNYTAPVKKAASKKINKPHPQSQQKHDGIDEYLKSVGVHAGSAASSSQSNNAANATVIVFDEALCQAYKELMKIDACYNVNILNKLLDKDKECTQYMLMKEVDSSFLHVVAVLKKKHNSDEIDFYAKHIIKDTFAYKSRTAIPKKANATERNRIVVKTREYEQIINDMLEQSVVMLSSVVGGVDPRNLQDPSLAKLVVLQTLASCEWKEGQTTENLANVVGLMRHLSQFYSLEACARGLQRAVLADHHFYLKMSFPMVMKPFLNFLFFYNPFYNQHRPHLSFVDIKLILSIFYPDYKIREEMCKFLLKKIAEFEHSDIEHAPSPYLHNQISDIRYNVMRWVNRPSELMILKEATIMNYNAGELNAVSNCQDVFRTEIEALKTAFNRNAPASAYNILYFIKNSNFAEQIFPVDDKFYPLYRLIMPDDSPLLLLHTSSQQQGHISSENLSMEAMKQIALSLIFVLIHLGILNIEQDTNYNSTMNNMGYCLDHFIASAMALTEDPMHLDSLYALYQYVRNRLNTNLIFNEVFYATLQESPEEAQLLQQAMLLMSVQSQPFTNSTSPTVSSNSGSALGEEALLCHEVYEDDDQSMSM